MFVDTANTLLVNHVKSLCSLSAFLIIFLASFITKIIREKITQFRNTHKHNLPKQEVNRIRNTALSEKHSYQLTML